LYSFWLLKVGNSGWKEQEIRLEFRFTVSPYVKVLIFKTRFLEN